MLPTALVCLAAAVGAVVMPSAEQHARGAAPAGPRQGYIFFMKAPTSPRFGNHTQWLQQDPDSFSEASFREVMAALNPTNASNPSMQIGLTFQWELLDCFLAPHTCNTSETVAGIINFLNAAVATQVPVQVTLDPIQFYFETNLWNWFDPSQPGYVKTNVANVEWTGWDKSNATMIAWRNWGSQFRMPTPQPNIASPALLAQTATAIRTVMTAIRGWYEAQTPSNQRLLVGVKIGEEVDVGVNYYYYPNGNQIYLKNPLNATWDPDCSKYGPKWNKGLSGGLPAQGYNLLRTLKLRTSGGPPTRDEITAGIQNYFRNALDACVDAWPALATPQFAGFVAAHAGAVSDPLMIKWDAPMVPPALPGYSFYFGPAQLNISGGPIGQPGLKTALEAYAPHSPAREFAVAEWYCIGCSTEVEWRLSFERIFNNPYGAVKYVRVYNLTPFATSPAAVEGLRQFMTSYSAPRAAQ
jgi:hypothetical protein